MRESQGGDPAGDLAGRGGGLYFSASVGILKIRRAVQREKVCGRGIQPFSPVVSPEVEFGCFMWLVLLLLLVAQVLLSWYK